MVAGVGEAAHVAGSADLEQPVRLGEISGTLGTGQVVTHVGMGELAGRVHDDPVRGSRGGAVGLTIWLESGRMHVRAVADALGHSSTSVTTDIYTHTSPAVAAAGADILGAVLTPEETGETR